MAKVKSIKKVGENIPQKCIKIDNPDGLFVLKNNLITHNSSEYIMRLYNDARGRVWSRMKNNYYGRDILDSSPNDVNNAIDNYIMTEARNDPRNYIVEGSVWKWNPEDYKEELEQGKVFKVYTGGKGNPPKILESDDPLLTPGTAEFTKIIDVPLSLKPLFLDDLVKAIKDQAGIPSGSANSLVYDYAPLEKMFDNSLRNIYTGVEAPASVSAYQLIWNQIKDIFFKYRAGKYEYYYKPWVPRCVAVDQSYSTCVTSIAVGHVERFEDSDELIHVIDFTVPIIPTKDDNINLEAIRCFIEDLRDLGNLRIEHVGFDQFQSEVTIQNLRRDGFDVEKVSTDKSTDPYLNMVALMNRGRIAVGKNLFLKNNIKSLHLSKTKKGKPKIDHDNSREGITSGDNSWEKGVLGMYAKDVSDTVADVIELNRKYYLVSEETWTGGPSIKTSSTEKDTAYKNLNNLLNKLGLR